ncbi:MAG: pyridoxal-phosphate dependent enzyme [Candidatus Bathyarchaeota archaeon]|nr:pyridoxal-phosphate dependent enzyme [Candidatus Bathyarchaeota archaeon]
MPQPFQQYISQLNKTEFYHWLARNGIGFTPLIRLPEQINPYDKQNPIYAKLEYTNFGESIKARAFATMYYLNKQQGKLNNKPKAIAATSGNFGLAGSYLLHGNYTFTVNMSEKGAKENIGLASKLLENGTKIETFPDGYCPTVGAKRGEAIAAARFVEKIDNTVVNYDQYDDWANPLAHYLTTGPEIYAQTGGKIAQFVNSLGTCATMVGTGIYLKEVKSEIKLIGLYPQNGHHQLGLRSRDELGATKFYQTAKELCINQIEVTDKDAFKTMERLWENGLPAGISSGGNVWGALQTAKQQRESGEEGLIVTTLPDSSENYVTFLQNHFEAATGKPFDSAIEAKLEETTIKTQRERSEHINQLKKGNNNVLTILANK